MLQTKNINGVTEKKRLLVDPERSMSVEDNVSQNQSSQTGALASTSIQEFQVGTSWVTIKKKISTKADLSDSENDIEISLFKSDDEIQEESKSRMIVADDSERTQQDPKQEYYVSVEFATKNKTKMHYIDLPYMKLP